MLAGFGFLLALSVPWAQGAEVVCYAPDGETRAPNDTYVPCNKLGITQSGVFSSCCRLDGNATDRDLCTTSGLCLNKGVVFREYCTDPRWKSPACVNVCTDPESGGSVNGTVELTPCTDGTYCCGHNNLTCCGTEYAVKVPIQASVLASEKAKNESSAYKKMSIGLGAALAAVSIASVAAILWLMRRNKSLQWQLTEKHEPAQSNWESEPTADEYHDSYRMTPTSATTFVKALGVQDSGQYKPIQDAPPLTPKYRVSKFTEVEGSQQQPSELPHYPSELDGGDAPSLGERTLPREW